MENRDPLYHIWLSFRLGVASKYFLTLCDRFDDAFEIYRAEEEALSKISGLPERIVTSLCDKSLEEARKCIFTCKRYNIKISVYGDKNYPRPLMDLRDPPVVLYYVGEIPRFDERLSLSVVGTRKMSEYGKQTAYKISYELAAADMVIVSGMALGIDGVAMCGALEGGGKVIAVLGSGVDVIYPKEHRKLYNYIVRQGAVISEYPPGSRPEPHHFPVRNRLISGLTDGTLVVEGEAKSGSMITAKHAIEQGKTLFAVPGSVDEQNSEGTNALLRSGANITISSCDIIDLFKSNYGGRVPIDEVMFKKAQLVKTDCDVALDKMKICARIYGRDYSYGVEKDPAERLREEQKRSLLATPSKTKKNLNDSSPRGGADDDNSAVDASAGTEQGNKRTKTDAAHTDRSSQIYASLSEIQKRIFDAIPIGEYVTADEIISATGCKTSDILTAVTMLELKGLIDIHPGGQYGRK